MGIQRKSRRTFGSGMAKAIEYNTASHYVNSPKHAYALLLRAQGELNALVENASDDPALQSIQLLDSLPRIAGMIIEMHKWADAVNRATPDQIPIEGARI